MQKVKLGAPLLLAATLFAAVLVSAQSIPQRVNVTFKFNLGDNSFPAGQYYVRHDTATDFLELLGKDRNLLAKVKVVTRLAPPPGARGNSNVRLIFDEVGENRYLSEVWTGGADGLLVRATSERHKHQTLEGEK